MERKANYTVVGAFVIFFAVALVSFIFWLGRYGSETKDYDYYKTYFSESVSGLTKESPVKFKGLEVGFVENIEISRANPEEIEIFFKVKKGTPIKVDSYTTIGSQGLTGLGYIEVKGGSKTAKNLYDGLEQRALIKSEKSFFSKLGDDATKISEKVSSVLEKIDTLLSPKNLNSIETLLANVNTLSESLKQRNEELKQVLENAVLLEKSAKVGADKLPEAIDKVKQLSSNSNALIDELKSGIKRGDYNVNSMTKESIHKLNETLDEAKVLMLETQQLVKNLNESPSDIFFKQKSNKPGPGER